MTTCSQGGLKFATVERSRIGYEKLKKNMNYTKANKKINL